MSPHGVDKTGQLRRGYAAILHGGEQRAYLYRIGIAIENDRERIHRFHLAERAAVADAHRRGCDIFGEPLLRIGIVLHLLIAPWFTIIEIGFWGIPTLLLVAFFFLGVELVDRIVEEPFGTERDDLRLEAYCETVRQNVLAIVPAEARPTEVRQAEVRQAETVAG